MFQIVVIPHLRHSERAHQVLIGLFVSRSHLCIVFTTARCQLQSPHCIQPSLGAISIRICPPPICSECGMSFQDGIVTQLAVCQSKSCALGGSFVAQGIGHSCWQSGQRKLNALLCWTIRKARVHFPSLPEMARSPFISSLRRSHLHLGQLSGIIIGSSCCAYSSRYANAVQAKD